MSIKPKKSSDVFYVLPYDTEGYNSTAEVNPVSKWLKTFSKQIHPSMGDYKDSVIETIRKGSMTYETNTFNDNFNNRSQEQKNAIKDLMIYTMDKSESSGKILSDLDENRLKSYMNSSGLNKYDIQNMVFIQSMLSRMTSDNVPTVISSLNNVGIIKNIVKDTVNHNFMEKFIELYSQVSDEYKNMLLALMINTDLLYTLSSTVSDLQELLPSTSDLTRKELFALPQAPVVDKETMFNNLYISMIDFYKKIIGIYSNTSSYNHTDLEQFCQKLVINLSNVTQNVNEIGNLTSLYKGNLFATSLDDNVLYNATVLTASFKDKIGLDAVAILPVVYHMVITGGGISVAGILPNSIIGAINTSYFNTIAEYINNNVDTLNKFSKLNEISINLAVSMDAILKVPMTTYILSMFTNNKTILMFAKHVLPELLKDNSVSLLSFAKNKMFKEFVDSDVRSKYTVDVLNRMSSIKDDTTVVELSSAVNDIFKS